MNMPATKIHPRAGVTPAIANLPSARGRRSLVLFQLAGQGYALNMSEVQEIVMMAALARPPGLPSVLEGLLNIGGAAVPVVRLDRLFRLPERPPSMFTPLVILRDPDYHVALMVDHVNEIVSVADDDVVPVRENHAFNDCAEGVVTVHDRVFLFLSAGRLLLEKEAQCFAEFEAVERARLLALEQVEP